MSNSTPSGGRDGNANVVGADYEVGYGKPPKHTRFKKGVSGNRYGRPRKKPDLAFELTRVLRERISTTVEGHPQQMTIQQALLMRLRDQALLGEVWACRLMQKVIEAIPDKSGDYDHIEAQLRAFRVRTWLQLSLEDAESGAVTQPSDQSDVTNAE